MQVNEKTVSNESGHFELNDLASGDYEIRFMIHDGRSEPIELGAVFHIKSIEADLGAYLGHHHLFFAHSYSCTFAHEICVAKKDEKG